MPSKVYFRLACNQDMLCNCKAGTQIVQHLAAIVEHCRSSLSCDVMLAAGGSENQAHEPEGAGGWGLIWGAGGRAGSQTDAGGEAHSSGDQETQGQAADLRQNPAALGCPTTAGGAVWLQQQKVMLLRPADNLSPEAHALLNYCVLHQGCRHQLFQPKANVNVARSGCLVATLTSALGLR